jgi:hypothetical protein
MFYPLPKLVDDVYKWSASKVASQIWARNLILKNDIIKEYTNAGMQDIANFVLVDSARVIEYCKQYTESPGKIKFTDDSSYEIDQYISDILNWNEYKELEKQYGKDKNRFTNLLDYFSEFKITIYYLKEVINEKTQGEWDFNSKEMTLYVNFLINNNPGNILLFDNIKNIFNELRTTIIHEIQHLSQDLLTQLFKLETAVGIPKENRYESEKFNEYGTKLTESEDDIPVHLIDVEFYPYILSEVYTFKSLSEQISDDLFDDFLLYYTAKPNQFLQKFQEQYGSNYSQTSLIRDNFFSNLKAHNMARWQEAVGEFMNELKKKSILAKVNYFYDLTKQADQIEGGLADDHKSSEFDKEQLEIGYKIEKEHTSDQDLAEEIAMDHLVEDSDYYEKLPIMEDMTLEELQAFEKLLEEI